LLPIRRKEKDSVDSPWQGKGIFNPNRITKLFATTNGSLLPIRRKEKDSVDSLWQGKGIFNPNRITKKKETPLIFKNKKG